MIRLSDVSTSHCFVPQSVAAKKSFPKKEEKRSTTTTTTSLDLIHNLQVDASLKLRTNGGAEMSVMSGSFNINECANFMTKEWTKFMSLVERGKKEGRKAV